VHSELSLELRQRDAVHGCVSPAPLFTRIDGGDLGLRGGQGEAKRAQLHASSFPS
jgi:hypothetical protein